MDDLIETKVLVSTFIEKIWNALRILPIGLTMDNKTSLFAFY